MSALTVYLTNSGLPDVIRDQLSDFQQDVYRIAFNNAIAGGKSPEDAKVRAMQAVDMLEVEQKD